MPRIVPLSLVLLLSLGLSACGKRGPLEPPPGQTQARETAKAEAKAQSGGNTKAAPTGADAAQNATATPGQTKLGGKKRVPITAPKRDLFIDGILD